MAFIAVYGTLRPGGRAWQAFGLASHMRHLGPCRIAGRLVDLGGYPGLVDADESAAHSVAGDLLACDDAAVIAKLDAYEGEGYARVTMRLIDPPVDAMVWQWHGDVAGAPPVPGNDWALVPLGGQIDPLEQH